MSDTSEKQNWEINHRIDLPDLQALHNPGSPEVTLLVNNVKFPAHKSILASRSSYFQALFFGGMKESCESQVVLKDVNHIAFDHLLKYIYTGKVDLRVSREETAFDLLGLCDQWGFQELGDGICDILAANLQLSNIFPILEKGINLALSRLISACGRFCDERPDEILEHPLFPQISREALTTLVSRSSFFTQEEKIYEGVTKWVAKNDDDSVLSCVRLSLLSPEYLNNVVKCSGFFPLKEISDAIEESKGVQAIRKWEYRGYLPTPSPNSIIPIDITGAKSDLYHFGSRDLTNIDLSDTAVVFITLPKPTMLNTIRFYYVGRDFHTYSYFIETCPNKNQPVWEPVVDYTKYHCQWWQLLHFTLRVVHQVKLVATRNVGTASRMIPALQVRLYNLDRSYNVDPGTGLIIPTENVARKDMCASVINDENGQGVVFPLQRGSTRPTDENICQGLAAHVINQHNPHASITIQLVQPYLVSSMRFLLWNGPPGSNERRYSYCVEVSADIKNWTMVSDKRGDWLASWQEVTFEAQPVVYIRIRGTRVNSGDRRFGITYFECPSTLQGN